MSRPVTRKPAANGSAGLDEPDQVWLGRQLRALRKQRGLSLEDVQAETGRSIGFLSQIERGKSRPSVDDLVKIAALLDVPFPLLFYRADGEERGVVVRSGNRPRLGYRNGISDFLLSPNLGGNVEVLLTTFGPWASSGEAPFHEKAGHETGFVIAGQLTLWVDGVRFELNKGDSFGYASRQPHRYLNPTGEPTEVVWIISRS